MSCDWFNTDMDPTTSFIFSRFPLVSLLRTGLPISFSGIPLLDFLPGQAFSLPARSTWGGTTNQWKMRDRNFTDYAFIIFHIFSTLIAIPPYPSPLQSWLLGWSWTQWQSHLSLPEPIFLKVPESSQIIPKCPKSGSGGWLPPQSSSRWPESWKLSLQTFHRQLGQVTWQSTNSFPIDSHLWQMWQHNPGILTS